LGIDEYGEIENYRISQSLAELIAIKDAETYNCTANKDARSCFWVIHSDSRGEYYDIAVEGHPTCVEEIEKNSIIRYRVMSDGTFEGRYQVVGHWNCPNCAALKPKKSTNKQGCIIITACYGEISQEVQISRFFRDNFLVPNFLGRLAIDGYYKISPYIVDKMKQFKILKKVVRTIIVNPIVVYEKSKIKKRLTIKKILSSFIYYPCVFFITIAGIFSKTQKLISSLFKVY
jgi:hypothetical protein